MADAMATRDMIETHFNQQLKINLAELPDWPKRISKSFSICQMPDFAFPISTSKIRKIS